MTSLHKATHKAPTLPLPLREEEGGCVQQFVQVGAEFVQMFVHGPASQLMVASDE
jgi:hypothetical protein